MPRKPQPQRQPRLVYPNGTQSVRERFANRLAALGYEPGWSPLIIGLWLQNPMHPLNDPELRRLVNELETHND